VSEYYDKEGKPLELLEWAELLKDEEYKRVGLDRINGLLVSTVWLGLNHSWIPGSPPLIYETKIFASDSRDIYQRRYSTLEQAEQGHRDAVNLCFDPDFMYTGGSDGYTWSPDEKPWGLDETERPDS
jgi:hypothetical protein